MFEILLQDSYTDWVVPLTVAIVWILSWQLFTLSDPVSARGKMDCPWKNEIVIPQTITDEHWFHTAQQLVKTVKRKECPDDPEGPHLSI